MATRIASSPSLRDTKAHGYLLCLNLSQIPLSFGYVCVEMKLKSFLVFKLFDV
jgi:hypothetical protein